ncbi:hypothetical protein YN1HA_28390 [Sulfurisphaera ohwakuensis]
MTPIMTRRDSLSAMSVKGMLSFVSKNKRVTKKVIRGMNSEALLLRRYMAKKVKNMKAYTNASIYEKESIIVHAYNSPIKIRFKPYITLFMSIFISRLG